MTPNLPPPQRRRTGKVANLPKDQRDLINSMLLDGHTYATIIEKLAERGVSLNAENLSNWKDGGHQDWLNQQAWREEMRLRAESFSDLLNAADPVQLPESGLQLAVIGICEQLRALSEPGANTDPDQHVRVANSLARLSRSILQVQQYRDTITKAKAAELHQRDPNAEGTPKEKETMFDIWRNFFGHDLGRRKDQRPVTRDQGPLEEQKEATGSRDSGNERDQGPGTRDESRKQKVESRNEGPDRTTGQQDYGTEMIGASISNQSPPSENTIDHGPSTMDCGPTAQSLAATSNQTSPASQVQLHPNGLPKEFCLECGELLPERLPNGSRPYEKCRNCGVILSNSLCTLPSIEGCPYCKAKLPRGYVNGKRPCIYCHRCYQPLPEVPPHVIAILKKEQGIED